MEKNEGYLNYCMNKNKGKYRFMLVVSNLLPILTDNSYKSIVDKLTKQLNYIKVPSEWCKKENFLSIREELWGYKFPNSNDTELSSSIFDRFVLFTFFSYVPSIDHALIAVEFQTSFE